MKIKECGFGWLVRLTLIEWARARDCDRILLRNLIYSPIRLQSKLDSM
jgi:hypothetical protein